MRSLLFSMLVHRYYKLNTGFFLLVFILLFGILNARDTLALHHAIMIAVSGSLFYLAIFAAVCALYSIKCFAFCIKVLALPESAFLYHMQGQGNGKQLLALLQVQAAVYLPVLLYAILSTVAGFQQGRVVLPVILLLLQVAICAAPACCYWYTINSTWKKPAITLPAFTLVQNRPFHSYLLHYSLHSRKGTFASVKLLSLLLLQLMVAANTGNVSREAMCVLIMFLISAHALLPLYYVQFAEQELALLRNLPISLPKRFSLFAVTYAVIFVPEFLFLVYNTHHAMPGATCLSLYVLAVAQMCLYTAILYSKKMTADRYTTFVFGLFFGTILLLASLNVWVMCAIESVTAVTLFARFYYGYELSLKKGED